MTAMKMSVTIGEKPFTATLENNAATHERVKMMEKARDIVLYGGNQIVMFYGSRACLKIHSRHLHAPLCVIFAPNSVNVARYASLIWHKSPTNCDAHLPESNFQTRSNSWDIPRVEKMMICPVGKRRWGRQCYSRIFYCKIREMCYRQRYDSSFAWQGIVSLQGHRTFLNGLG